MDNKQYKYDFFISYKHGNPDSEIAKYLQQLLEQYPVPKEIQAKSKKEKMGRVFRDESELSASSNLTADIEEQLKNSEYLIVICSPATRNSRWVTQEIETFIRLRDQNHILPVLIEGEPEDSFPDVLLNTEPMAADFRGSTKADIKRQCKNELLRLVAPVLHCSYDELKQRHKAYQFRKFAIAASIITVIALLFSGYSIYQNIQIKKNYKEKQINQAKLLADKSTQLLEEGDREAALLVALEALPDSSKDNSMPFVGDAQMALENALLLYTLPDQDGFYPNHILEMRDVLKPHYDIDPQERVLATTDKNNTIYYWDLDSATLISSHTIDHSIYSYDIFFGNNSLSYICYYKQIICFDYRNNEIVWELDFSNEEILYGHFAISPDKNILLCADTKYIPTENQEYAEQLFFKYIDAKSGETLKEFSDTTQYKDSISVHSITWSPDNTTACIDIYTNNNSSYLVLTDYNAGISKQWKTFQQNTYSIKLCKFIDSNTLVYLWGSNGDISLNAIYTATDLNVTAFSIQTAERLWEVTTSAISRDTVPLIQTADVRTQDGETKQLITIVAFSKVINIMDGMIISESGYASEIAGVFTDDLQQYHLTDDGILHKTNSLDGSAFNEAYGNTDLGVDELVFSVSYSDTEIALFQNDSSNIYLFNQNYDTSGIELKSSNKISSNCCFDESGEYILGVRFDYETFENQLYLWNSNSGEILFNQMIKHEDYESSLSFEFIGTKYFYYATTHRILLFSLEDCKEIFCFTFDKDDYNYGNINQIYVCDADAPQIYLSTLSNDVFLLTGETLKANAVIYGNEMEELFVPYTSEGDSTYYTYYFFPSPNGRYLLFQKYYSFDHTKNFPLLIFDCEEKVLLSDLEITPFPDAALENYTFSEDSTHLIVYNKDQNLQVIDLVNQQVVVTLSVDGNSYHQFWLSPDNRYLFIHANEHLLKMYDLKEDTYIMNSDAIPYDITAWTFYEDGEYLIIQSHTQLSYPIHTLFYQTETGTYEAISIQRSSPDATLDKYVVDSGSSLSYVYKRPSLDEMIELAKEFLNGRELTELEIQKYNIEK